MQEQSKASAGQRPSGGVPPSSAYDSDAMERRVRQVKAGGIAPLLQVITGRIKPGSTTNSVQQNRSGAAAGVPAASSAPPAMISSQVLKCPRCNSLNTKFCYYNNYSLLQPRHFCKNCRRYWTKGGALRNVPVGGGCRKNKRSAASTPTASASAATGAAMTTISSLPSCPTKHGSMQNMMIRENSAASCRNSTSAPMITSAVHKAAALQGSMPPPAAQTHFPSLYSYTASKNGQIQPSANSLSDSTASFFTASDHPNLTQYPLFNPRLTPFMPPNQAASFHSFLNLKQAISSLASPNRSLIGFNASLPPSSALPFLSHDHHISTANLDAALQAPIHDPLMGLDLINASATASLVPLIPSVTSTHSTTSSSSLFNINNTPSSLALTQEFNHTNDHSNPAADHQLTSILPSCNDQKASILYRNDQHEELQAFGSSISSESACKGLKEMQAAAAPPSQVMQQEMMHSAASSKGLQNMQHAAAIMEEGQFMQLTASSSMKDELVSDNFKMKGDGDGDGDAKPAAACCTNGSWGGAPHRSSFLEASGDDQPYWSCTPSTWPDDLST